MTFAWRHTLVFVQYTYYSTDTRQQLSSQVITGQPLQISVLLLYWFSCGCKVVKGEAEAATQLLDLISVVFVPRMKDRSG